MAQSDLDILPAISKLHMVIVNIINFKGERKIYEMHPNATGDEPLKKIELFF